AIAPKAVFRQDPDGRLGLQPGYEAVAAIVDGPWPPSAVEMAKLSFRGRRFVSLEIRPFRYDESSAHVSSPLTLTVRVDFNRPAGGSSLLSDLVAARDPQVDAALEGTVLNWDQGQGWRTSPAATRFGGPGRSLFGSGPNGTARAQAFDETQ